MVGIRALGPVVVTALLVAALSLACFAGKPAVAHSGALCEEGIVHLAGEPPQAPLELYRWKVRASGVGCVEAVRVARSYMKRRQERGWVCGSTHFEAGCRRQGASVQLRAVHPVGRGCGKVGFEANSDNVATGIRASRVTCSVARTLVRAVYDEAERFGFRCRSREYQPIGLPYVHWVCQRGRQRVRWLKA